MNLIPLGRSGLMVSEICLGTMTWGNRNTEAEGHAQIALALEHGVQFWDTAEMYPVNPIRAETVGRTEAIIGSWFAAHGGRDRVVVATKVTGAGQAAVRDGAPISPATMRAAVEGSLRRLRTDYIDLYQLHWTNRGSYHFRQVWDYAPPSDRDAALAHMEAILRTAADLVAEGKIRALGLSNETAWGTTRWIEMAERLGLPRVAAVQNEYSLLCRLWDVDGAEVTAMEEVPMLAFSPLATGLLTGKYRGDATPPGSRRAVNPTLGGRTTPQMFAAVEAYQAVADRHGLSLAQMAVAFCRSRPWTCIPIVGASDTDQLGHALAAAELRLSDAVLADIAAVRRDWPMPF